MDGARSGDSPASRIEGTHVAAQSVQHPQEEAMYACSICFETASHPVASTCGHLFGWECLFSWLRGRPRPCPVCRTNLVQGVNVIPVFTFTGVEDSRRAERPPSNSIPQRPPAPPPDRIPGPIPSPSPVLVATTNTAAAQGNSGAHDLTRDVLEEIRNDLTDNFEISRERVDSLGQTVENLVEWNLRLLQENDRNAQAMDYMNRWHARQMESMNRWHAQEMGALHRRYAEEMRRILTQEYHSRQWQV